MSLVVPGPVSNPDIAVGVSDAGLMAFFYSRWCSLRGKGPLGKGAGAVGISDASLVAFFYRRHSPVALNHFFSFSRDVPLDVTFA